METSVEIKYSAEKEPLPDFKQQAPQPMSEQGHAPKLNTPTDVQTNGYSQLTAD
jgi:hypothetical protein